MVDPFLFVIACLAAYRITRFLVEDSLMGMGSTETYEKGQISHSPNSPMAERVWQFAYNDDGSNKGFIRGRIGDLLGCTFCLGFWVSCGVLAALTWTWPWTPGVQFQLWVLTAFAVAGVQAFLNSRPGA